ncbi:MAG: DUF1566 domain-containing protein, partial [bacterium]
MKNSDFKKMFFLFFCIAAVFVSGCVSDEKTDDEQNQESENSTENNNEDSQNEENEDGSHENTEKDSDNESVCGNGMIEEGEVCDRDTKPCAELNSEYISGQAPCNSNCSAYDMSMCNREDSDDENSEGFDKNAEGFWVDPETKLIWEEPIGKGSMSGFGSSFADAENYCNNLYLAGATDWRVPTIDELRTIVRGVSTTMSEGKCPTTEECSNQDNCNKDKDNTLGFGNSCLGCEALNEESYDPEISYLSEDDCLLSDREINNGVCYMVKNLTVCNKFWSSTPNTSAAGSGMNARWYLNFKRGLINSAADILNIEAFVRCVRTGTEEDIPEEQPLPEPSEDEECIRDSHCEEEQWCVDNECVMQPEPVWTDPDTGYTWQTNPAKKTWSEAAEYCENLELEDRKDWQLPSVSQLKSLVIDCSETEKCEIEDNCSGYTACGG